MAKTAQVTGQMELNFTEQKSPKKRSIAKKSVSKPKKEIKKQIAFSSEHYEKATEIVKEREIIHFFLQSSVYLPVEPCIDYIIRLKTI